MPLRDVARRLLVTLALAGMAILAASPRSASLAQPDDDALSATASTTPLTYPLKASANRRYLVDQTDRPTLLVGDSPHSLFVNLTLGQAKHYYANRAMYGINAVWIEVLSNSYTGGRADGSTYDGIVPFTTPGDFSTANPAYFARVDQMIQLAGTHGLTVLLDAIDTGGWLAALQATGATRAYAYGAYLGNRYKSFPNIIWISGNDFQTWQSNQKANVDVAAIMAGIASADPNHLQTTELNYYVSGSLDNPLLVPYTTLAGAYTYYPTYAEVLREYNAARFRPVIMLEANYEFENNNGWDHGDPATLRRQEYWAMLSGAAGQFYGNHYTWTFVPGWESKLNTPGAVQLKWMKIFFERWRWWKLIPEQNHTIVTAGYGTFSSSGSNSHNNYVTVASIPGSPLVLAYCPTATTLTVDMTKMNRATTAQWFDPTNNTYVPVAGSPFANSGTRRFTTPGANGDGAFDWVLLLRSP